VRTPQRRRHLDTASPVADPTPGARPGPRSPVEAIRLPSGNGHVPTPGGERNGQLADGSHGPRHEPDGQLQRPAIACLATRALDLALAGLALLLLGPVLAVLALLVRLTTPGPALFRQERVGYGERSFRILKFRTMYVNSRDESHRSYVTQMLTGDDPAGDAQGALFKLDNDRRITPVGGFLRRTSLDELPQLFNVLKGEMSLVGPRPSLPWETTLFQPHHRLRFQVKPGITGLWQVSGRNRLSMPQALELDVQYVQNWSFVLDLRILARTLPVVLKGDAR
jgi:lipopolysaccharide/colanic/teichoic acid biosynthesis glycosyltransferase